MLEDLTLPPGLELIRTTPEFTAESLPKALRRSHHVAAENWGLLRVVEGSVVYVVEATGDSRRLEAGETQVIEPEVSHHVEPAPDAKLVIEFHR